MPPPPRPFTLACRNCAWQQTMLPCSDLLKLNQDWFLECPQCRQPQLERRAASRRDILRARLDQFLKLDH
jgi:Zn finger protein HypA/HybF involved in hydrogenase expression